MPEVKSEDPLLQWGHVAAIGIVVVAMIAAVVLIIRAVVTGGDVTRATALALLVLVIGAGSGFLVLRMRKARERAVRPAWMGTTTAWRDGIKSKISEKKDTPQG
jgi:hypothetical protein